MAGYPLILQCIYPDTGTVTLIHSKPRMSWDIALLPESTIHVFFFFPEFPLRSDIELYCHVSLGFFKLKFFHNPIQPTLKTSKQKHQSRAPEMTHGLRTYSTPPEILNSQQVAQYLICELIPREYGVMPCSLWTPVHTYQCAPPHVHIYA